MKLGGRYKIWHFSSLICFICTACRAGLFTPKTYIFHDTAVDWYEAYVTCRRNGGTLPIFDDNNDVMDVIDQVRESKNTSVWIGLNSSSSDGVSMDFDDRAHPPVNLSVCPSVLLQANSFPGTAPCSVHKPFYCLHLQGYCRYRKYPHTTIVGYNTFVALSISLQECRQMCDQTTEFTCLSFEYNDKYGYCQLSSTNRWLVPDSFAHYVTSWVYYHRTCVWAFTSSNVWTFTTTHSPSSTTSTIYTSTSTDKEMISVARRYIFVEDPMSWTSARDYCHTEGGILATLYDESVLPEAELVGNEQSRRVWIGLTKLNSQEWHWTDSWRVDWTKWKYTPSSYDRCGAVTLDSEGWWYPMNCGSQLPFICQFKGESCRYEAIKDAVLVVHNRVVLYNISLEQCQALCESAVDFECRSFDYHVQDMVCQLSDQNRWTAAGFLKTNIPGWLYYHRRCSFGVPVLTTSTTEFTTSISTTEFTTTESDTTSVSSSEATTAPQSSTVSFDEVFEVMKEELEEMGKSARKKKLEKSRTSVWEARPSAVSVGAVATVILVSLLALIVVSDIATICEQCRQLHFKSKKKKPKQEISKMSTQRKNIASDLHPSRNSPQIKTEDTTKHNSNEEEINHCDITVDFNHSSDGSADNDIQCDSLVSRL